jgi:hypothetical protein
MPGYHRRHLGTEGAVAAAEALELAEKAGKIKPGLKSDLGPDETQGQKSREYFGKLFGCGHQQVRMARALLRSDREAAVLTRGGYDSSQQPSSRQRSFLAPRGQPT